ncbi:MAG: hypothetical protein JO279_11850 [Verrucomicrobia bacterium]|nr:hypothetical protein [Verrucomicrobiota bacterium]
MKPSASNGKGNLRPRRVLGDRTGKSYAIGGLATDMTESFTWAWCEARKTLLVGSGCASGRWGELVCPVRQALPQASRAIPEA